MDQYPKSKYKAILKRVVDGDTIDVLIDLGFGVFYKSRVRFYGIDAYETRLGKNTTIVEKEKGLEGKQFLIDKIPIDSEIELETYKHKGKYGRYIATVYYNGININKLMVSMGYAIYKEY